MGNAPRRTASVDDFWAIPESSRFHELRAGQIIPKAAPSGEHGDAQAGVVSAIRPHFQRRHGAGGPGGWWIATEVEVLLLGTEVVRPDVAGWRRERVPTRPTGTRVSLPPTGFARSFHPKTRTTTR